LFDIVDTKRKKRFSFDEDRDIGYENEIMCFGPNQTVVISQSSGKLIFIGYKNMPLMKITETYKLPRGLNVLSMWSDEDKVIFIKGALNSGKKGLWMLDNNSKIFHLFELEFIFNILSPIRIEYVTPTIICTNIDGMFYVYDMGTGKIIFKKAINSTIKNDMMTVSPDGRTLFRASRTNIYITRFAMGGSYSEYEAVDLAINTLEARSTRTLWTDDDDEISLKLFTPDPSLKILRVEGLDGGILDIKMIKNRLDIDCSDMHLDVIFDENKILFPLFRSKRTDSWARIMSNNTLETNLIWPAPGIPIDVSQASLLLKSVKDVSLPSLSVSLAAWAVNLTQPNPERSFVKAKEKYLEGLVQAIATQMNKNI